MYTFGKQLCVVLKLILGPTRPLRCHVGSFPPWDGMHALFVSNALSARIKLAPVSYQYDYYRDVCAKQNENDDPQPQLLPEGLVLDLADAVLGAIHDVLGLVQVLVCVSQSLALKLHRP